MTTAFSEVEHLVWYCRACGGAYKSQPVDDLRGCKCETPVAAMQPTRVTQVVDNRRRKAVTQIGEREAQIRSIIKPGFAKAGRRVRITFEASVEKAWYEPTYDGDTIIEAGKIVMVVTGPNGHPMVIDTGDTSVTLERPEGATD